MPFLRADELVAIGFRSIGRNVLLSDKASIYNPAQISISDHARIDDFCLLSAGEGGIFIGRYVHIACYTCLIGAERITLDDFSGVSSRVAFYSSSDDFSGMAMAHPTVPDEFRQVTSRPVTLGRHAIVGTGSTVLPGVTIGEGSAIGAMSLVTHDCDPFYVYVGIPARKLMPRKKNLLFLEKQFLNKHVKDNISR